MLGCVAAWVPARPCFLTVPHLSSQACVCSHPEPGHPPQPSPLPCLGSCAQADRCHAVHMQLETRRRGRHPPHTARSPGAASLAFCPRSYQ